MAPTRSVIAEEIIDQRYRILRPIAEGGMGTVFLAEHVRIKRRFAIKFLHRELVADASMVTRFAQEAFAAGTLGHPHIAAATDMGTTPDGVPYIVYEYLEGTLLTDEIRRGVMTVRRAVTIATQIASALGIAHAAGVVHLDLKADNVFLTDQPGMRDHVKVLDFGIARFLGATDGPGPGDQVWGTPAYMAPEQVTRPERVDARADVYALGVLLYEMLTGHTPFLERDPRALMYRVAFDPPPPLGRPHVPAELERVILERMLAKSPELRFQSMREVEDALRPIAARAATVRGSSPMIPIVPILPHAGTQPVPALSPQPAAPRPSLPLPRRNSYAWSRRVVRPPHRRDE